MKRLFSILIILMVCVLALSSCVFDSNQQIALKNVQVLIECIEQGDFDKTKKLFAKNKIADIDNFDDSVQELFAYCEGEFVSRINLALKADVDSHDGAVVKSYDVSYDYNTTAGKYRIALKWYMQDTNNADNVGIWSLYIIRFDDDISPEHAYWGDNLWTNGINIGKVYEGEW